VGRAARRPARLRRHRSVSSEIGRTRCSWPVPFARQLATTDQASRRTCPDDTSCPLQNPQMEVVARLRVLVPSLEAGTLSNRRPTLLLEVATFWSRDAPKVRSHANTGISPVGDHTCQRCTLPTYIQDDPSQAGCSTRTLQTGRAFEALTGKAVCDLLPASRHRVELAALDGDATVVECAAEMAWLSSSDLVCDAVSRPSTCSSSTRLEVLLPPADQPASTK
jgi:hypothetical protein